MLIWIDVFSETYLKPPNPNGRRLGLSCSGDSSVDMRGASAPLSPCEHRELPAPRPTPQLPSPTPRSPQVLDGRKPTGGKLEVKVRLREPLSGQDVQMVTENWLVLEPRGL